MKTSHNNAKTPRILVVDDEAAIANLVAEKLQRAGMEACVFASSAEALAAVQEQAVGQGTLVQRKVKLKCQQAPHLTWPF